MDVRLTVAPRDAELVENFDLSSLHGRANGDSEKDHQRARGWAHLLTRFAALADQIGSPHQFRGANLDGIDITSSENGRLLCLVETQALDLVRPVAVRLRRDFKLLLALIHAHALLHRERRDRDDQGRILATLDDYAVVRELVADLFAEGVDATVKPETRETVAAVKALDRGEVSLIEISKVLKLDKGAASRRVADAVLRGYLVNNETRKGRPARIAIGDAMPGEIEILPHPDRLADRCSVAVLSEGMSTPSPPADCDAELVEIEI